MKSHQFIIKLMMRMMFVNESMLMPQINLMMMSQPLLREDSDLDKKDSANTRSLIRRRNGTRRRELSMMTMSPES